MGCVQEAYLLEDEISAVNCGSNKANFTEEYARSEHSNGRSMIIDKYGSDAAKGALFRFSIRFQGAVFESNQQVLGSSMVVGGMGRDRAFVIGIHARHANDIVQTGFVKYVEEKDCIRHVLLETRPKFGERYCVIIVSTDRNHTLVGLSTFANTLGCEVLNAKEKKSTNSNDQTSDGFAMTADLELLSQSDFFLGSTQGSDQTRTSFSSLVASLIALKHRGPQNTFWVPSEKCDSDTVQPLVDTNSTHQSTKVASMYAAFPCNPKFLSDLDNKAIKSSRGKEVFLIKNCTRHSIPNWDTFLAMKIPEWDITVIDDQKMKLIELGTPLEKITSS